MARVGLCRLNSEGVKALQARFRQGRWANVAAFCNAIGIPRATYYHLIAREKWFEQATILDKLTAIGIPAADQAGLCEFRDIEPLLATLTNLPLQPTSFVGRETEKETLKQMLNSSPLLTLTGSGGCGKTRLALEVGAQLLPDFPQGVWLVELASLTDPDLVDQALLAALGLREEAGRSAIETALTHLKSRQLLLILDNCEHLVGACAHLANALLRSCAGVKLLATSRTPLQVGGETVWRVPSLPTPEPEVLASEKEPWGLVLEYDACRLFVERARGHRSDLEMSRSSAVSVAGICARLDGIPLAIELAAARVRMLSVEEIEGRLDQRFRLLIGGSRTVLARHQTLRALIDWSWELLEAPEKSLLSRLSVFAGGWTLEAAEAVCYSDAQAQTSNASDTAVPNAQRLTPNAYDVLDLLGSLVDKSLVVAETRGETTRYCLLETVRQYARDRLAESGESDAVRARHRDYFLAFSEEAEPKLIGPEQGEWLQRLEAEHENLRAALDWSLSEETGSGEGLRLCGAMGWFWHVRGHLSEGRGWCERALGTAGGQQRTKERANALDRAGSLAFYQGDYATARANYEESLAISREIGDRSGVANSLMSLGNVASAQGDYASARSYYEESLTIRREIGDRLGISLSLMGLGIVAHSQGDYASAQGYYEESLTIKREIGNRQGIAHSLNNLGNLASVQGDYATSRAYLEESLGIFREIGNRNGIANSLLNLGSVAADQGDYASARTCYEESLTIRREIGDRQGISLSLMGLGNIAYYQGDYASARAYYEESLTIQREIGDWRGIALSLNNLGGVAEHQGDSASARAYYEESLTIRREIGDRLGIAVSLMGLGNIAYCQGDYASAQGYFEESLTIQREIGNRRGIADSLEAFANLAVKESRSERAAVLWGAAEALHEEIGSPLAPSAREEYDREVATARQTLGEAAFAAAWEEGRTMIMEQVAAYALEETFRPEGRHRTTESH